MNSWILEGIGYLASILVAISLMMRSVLRLRIINLLGSIAFTVYGLLIHAYPVAAVNGFIVLVNIYYLREMMTAKTFFDTMEVRPDSTYLRTFLKYYAQDIERFFPGFRFVPNERQVIWFVLRDMVPVGLMIAEPVGQELQVLLDYVIPGYRDLKPGAFLYGLLGERFKAQGIRQISTTSASEAHQGYLRRMGFSPAGGDRYGRSLDS